jgi:hypothetical protein
MLLGCMSHSHQPPWDSFYEYLISGGYVTFAKLFVAGLLATIIIRSIAILFKPQIHFFPRSKWTYLIWAGLALFMSWFIYEAIVTMS